MSGVSAIETLRALGAEAISMQTHISPDNIRKLLEGDFEAFSAIQFNGFATIIEREYDLDLSEWRLRFSAQTPEPEVPLSEQENDPFANAAKAERQKRVTALILGGLLAAVIVATYFVFSSGEKKEKIELNNTAIEKAKANMASMKAASSASTLQRSDAIQEAHRSETAEAVSSPQSVHYDDLIIRPRSTIWLGVIDADTHVRQTRTKDAPWRLDGSHRWLVVTGHGYVSFDCGGEDHSFARKQRILLLYEKGACREVDEAEFRAENKGRIW